MRLVAFRKRLISDIYRRNTGRIIDCVGDGLCLCKSCEIIAVVQMFRI